ncbi:1,4-alpha-glucan-branching enzyme [bacterium B17]|nr:1,4-alpha-glucan-branching enzyme [bacterium B17]
MKKCSNVQLSHLSDDPFLKPYLDTIRNRANAAVEMESRLTEGKTSLADFSSGHEHFGLHRTTAGWTFREWAPNASSIHLIGDFSDWQPKEEYKLTQTGNGFWEACLPKDALHHGDLYRLKVSWPGGEGDRIPAYARRVVQDDHTKIFNAQVWSPEQPFKWKCNFERPPQAPLIYEGHVGMAQEKEGIGTYTEFRENILPRIKDMGYNTVQLMAVMEHPYYGSFGYHVANFFAASSRFGTPEELKELIDAAHGMGLAVIMDLVHSHAVKNEAEGLSRFDGTTYQYFHEGPRGNHEAWDSRCFDYSKPEVLHFLLSNCRFWLDEYHIDGFRFDGITSMLYHHHGLGSAFDSYDRYFDKSVDTDAVTYLTLANKVIHDVRPDAITIAEDVSGMPGLGATFEDCGCGFDYRLAMGVPDCWFKLVNDTRDDDWNMDYLWHELTNRRGDEKTINYAESHDQALVGGKTLIFEMIDADMYDCMHIDQNNMLVDRGIALHKMIRLATLTTAGFGYLNFMGNEFGHPEWVDFPREGNGWSYHYARRQWSLRDDKSLKYSFLGDFDREMLKLFAKNTLIDQKLPMRLLVQNHDKVIACERGGFFFIFNFNPTKSFEDYGLVVPPGKYSLIMDTDEPRFGGHSRIEPQQSYFTMQVKENIEIRDMLRLYLPSRTALVLKRS